MAAPPRRKDAAEALRPFQGTIACHYVANVDPADIQDCLLELDPRTTLFIICSKSFRTEETLTNALVAREWLRNAGAGDADLDRHFLAITTNLSSAASFGIPAENCLPMWDWVGGRYSVSVPPSPWAGSTSTSFSAAPRPWMRTLSLPPRNRTCPC